MSAIRCYDRKMESKFKSMMFNVSNSLENNKLVVEHIVCVFEHANESIVRKRTHCQYPAPESNESIDILHGIIVLNEN